MSKKPDDKLSKLLNFGQSAGSKPAAAAILPIQEPILEETPPEIPVETPPPPVLEEGKLKQKPREGRGEAPSSTTKQSKPLLIRNVGFTEEDQQHLDRISELLREAGEFRPSISDLVRVALRGCDSLSAKKAKMILESSRKFDGRRKH